MNQSNTRQRVGQNYPPPFRKITIILFAAMLLSASVRAAPTSPIDAANAQLRTLLSPLARPNPQLLFSTTWLHTW